MVVLLRKYDMKTLFAIAGLVLLAACATEPVARAPHYWTRDGYNYGKDVNYGKNEFDRHWAGCNAQLALLPSRPSQSDVVGNGTSMGNYGAGLENLGNALGNIAADMDARDRFLRNCIRAQGWRDNPGVRPQ